MSNRKVDIHWQGQSIVTNIPVADNFWMRLSGYMFRSQPHVAGILFESSGSIQTTFMNFDLDVVFLTATNQICKIQRNVKPWRFVFSAAKSKKVLEVPSGRLPSSVKAGDVLQVIAIETSAYPRD